MSLDGKVVVITGAARGIGAEYAQAFAQRGARLTVADVVDPAATAQRARDSGAEAISVVTDVRSRDQADAMVAAAVRRWGRVDVLVNNAARYAGLYRGPLQDIPASEWDDVMAVNVRGVWNACAAAQAPMSSQQSGAIIEHLVHHGPQGNPGQSSLRRLQGRSLGDDQGHGARARQVRCSGELRGPWPVDNEASREGHETGVCGPRGCPRAGTQPVPRHVPV